MSYKDFVKSKMINTYDINDDYVDKKPEHDWEVNTVTENLKPVYNNGNKDYNISMRDVITKLNTSKYKISGTNVWLPDDDGNLIALPGWINKITQDVENAIKNYRVEMISTQGNIIKDKSFATILKAIIYENNIDVTSLKDKKYFKWARFSGNTEQDQINDAKWNLKWAEGAKEIPITHEDVNRNAIFQVQFVTEKEARIWEEAALSAYQNKIKELK